MNTIPPKLIQSAHHFSLACQASRQWSAMVANAIKKHGDRPGGGFVSGIYSEHFPAALKTRLRNLAHKVTEENAKAYATRPPRTHRETMLTLHRWVKDVEGTGYYG